MAFYIPIWKVGEDASSVEYGYGHSESDRGRLRIDKVSGAIHLVTPLPGDEGEQYFARAARKVALHWREGVLPERTCWAS